MKPVSSFRDPDNYAIRVCGSWYRVASAESAAALARLRSSATYSELVGQGALLPFDPVESGERAQVIAEAQAQPGRPPSSDSHVYRVPTVSLVSYPWEWTNDSLAAAGLLTLKVRHKLLEIGLDLKDAAASNVQFVGMHPIFIDIGSVEEWVPNPSWNAFKQYVENFINPLAVGQQTMLSAAHTWGLSSTRGLPSAMAREIMPRRRKLSPSLALLQLATTPRKGRETSEKRYSSAALENPESAKQATVALTRRLETQTRRLGSGSHKTTWANYGSRDHYTDSDLSSKTRLALAFVTDHATGSGPVLDVGGNDGMTAISVVEQLGFDVVVLEPDSGALEQLHWRIPEDSELRSEIQLVRGDLTNPRYTGGLLGAEFQSLFERIRPSATLCQAVLHHVVITQAVPMSLAIESLSRFSSPLQIEFATEDDPKVQLLISQIPHWRGSYSQEELIHCLGEHYSSVQVVGWSSATRVVVNAWNEA